MNSFEEKITQKMRCRGRGQYGQAWMEMFRKDSCLTRL